MIDVTWFNDGRADRPEKYLIPWNDSQSRQRAFLAGWTRYLGDGSYEKETLHWFTVGAYYASVFGDIPESQRRKLYYAALAEFLKSQKCMDWMDDQRLEALHLARLAPGF